MTGDFWNVFGGLGGSVLGQQQAPANYANIINGNLWYGNDWATTSGTTIHSITVGDWDADNSDDNDEPESSGPMAWLDARVNDVTTRGRKLLAA